MIHTSFLFFHYSRKVVFSHRKMNAMHSSFFIKNIRQSLTMYYIPVSHCVNEQTFSLIFSITSKIFLFFSLRPCISIPKFRRHTFIRTHNSCTWPPPSSFLRECLDKLHTYSLSYPVGLTAYEHFFCFTSTIECTFYIISFQFWHKRICWWTVFLPFIGYTYTIRQSHRLRYLLLLEKEATLIAVLLYCITLIFVTDMLIFIILSIQYILFSYKI